jgi:predicted deacylase
MRIGTLEAGPGANVFGRLKAAETHGRFSVDVPLHLVRGAGDGPTLVIQAGLSGLEIEPAMALPQLVKELDPAQLRGSVVVVPLLNSSGFEFEQVNAIWDDKYLNGLGRGRADGTVSERLIHTYYSEVVARADALLDIRTGAQWSYHRYAATYAAGDAKASEALAAALGLPHVLAGMPADATLASAAAEDGRVVVSAWIGGGPGLRDYRSEDLGRIRQAALNALRHLGMLAGAPEGEPAAILRDGAVVELPAERGLTFMDQRKRGQRVAAGEAIGIVRHPFTGATVAEVVAPKAGVLLHAGAVWPVVPEGTPLALVGEPADG